MSKPPDAYRDSIASHCDLRPQFGRDLRLSTGPESRNSHNVAVGDRFQIAHILNEVKDPTTGEVIDLATDKIGVIDITQVKDRVAIGTYSGPGAPKPGDVAEKH